jgi:hypothetical protein
MITRNVLQARLAILAVYVTLYSTQKTIGQSALLHA